MRNEVYGGILGLCVGDALGVPVEFERRETLRQNPVTGMRDGGTYGLPAGSWSDDSSMALCLADSLADRRKIDGWDICKRFLRWADEGAYTPFGEMFDIGMATRKALSRFAQGSPPEQCGCKGERENGNGSLMRILPLAFYLRARYGADLAQEPAMDAVHAVSAYTHAHPRSLVGCGLYVCAAAALPEAANLRAGLQAGINRAFAYYRADGWAELEAYRRSEDLDALAALPEQEIQSGGYVVSTLEAALWCLLTTGSYRDCVLKAVNLGDDTDTTAAVAGGLAGVYYGCKQIPQAWLDALARREWISYLCKKFDQALDQIPAN